MSDHQERICSPRSKRASIPCDNENVRLEELGLAVKLILRHSKGSLIMLLHHGYLHMIEFSKFDDLHDSYSVKIQEQIVYIHMVIINGKVHNNLLIRV